MSEDLPSPPPPFAGVLRQEPPLPPFAGVMHQEPCIPPQPQHDENSGSESEVELDSPPHLKIITVTEDVIQDPNSPTSPHCSPSCIDINPSLSPQVFTFGSDTEDLDEEEDAYFDSLVDNFTNAVADLGKYTSNGDIEKAAHERETKLCAETALKFYNSDENNKVKYELIHAITSTGILEDGVYTHVNFTAKGDQPNSTNELFFAELDTKGETYITICVLPLNSTTKVGGLSGSKYDNFNGEGRPIDAQHCYACGKGLKHPKNGELYRKGHIASGEYYYWT
ncbi:hypothetical protein ACP4OV_009654 [Aristida adscensionis]